MAGDNYYVLCPFYKKDETVNIRCEGVTKDSRLVLQFGTKKSREKYQDKFCKAKDYEKCLIHRMLMQKYPEK